MDKVLDKLGIYDLFVNLIAGIAMLSVLGFLSFNLYGWEIAKYIQEIDVFVVLILAYFIGIVFQELSNFIETTLYRIERKFSKNKRFRWTFILWFIPSLDRVLMTSEELKNHCGRNSLSLFLIKKKRKRDLDDTEINAVKELASKGITKGIECNVDNVYQYCKTIANKGKTMGRLSNDQSHASMARSLSLFSFIIFWFTLVLYLCDKTLNVPKLFWGTLIVSAFLFFVFLRRNKRFSEMRYVNTFRFCIYEDMEEKYDGKGEGADF